MSLSQLQHINAAKAANSVFILPAIPGVLESTEMVFFIVGDTALIKTGGKANPRYDFVWAKPARDGKPAKTSREVAREKYAARKEAIELVMREGL